MIDAVQVPLPRRVPLALPVRGATDFTIANRPYSPKSTGGQPMNVRQVEMLLARWIAKVESRGRPFPVHCPPTQASFDRIGVDVIERSVDCRRGINIAIESGSFLPISKARLVGPLLNCKPLEQRGPTFG